MNRMMVNLNQEDLNVSHAYIDFTFIGSSVNFTSVSVCSLFNLSWKMPHTRHTLHDTRHTSFTFWCRWHIYTHSIRDEQSFGLKTFRFVFRSHSMCYLILKSKWNAKCFRLHYYLRLNDLFYISSNSSTKRLLFTDCVWKFRLDETMQMFELNLHAACSVTVDVYGLRHGHLRLNHESENQFRYRYFLNHRLSLTRLRVHTQSTYRS